MINVVIKPLWRTIFTTTLSVRGPPQPAAFGLWGWANKAGLQQQYLSPLPHVCIFLLFRIWLLHIILCTQGGRQFICWQLLLPVWGPHNPGNACYHLVVTEETFFFLQLYRHTPKSLIHFNIVMRRNNWWFNHSSYLPLVSKSVSGVLFNCKRVSTQPWGTPGITNVGVYDVMI